MDARPQLRRVLVETGVKLGEAVGHRGETLPWVLDCRELLLTQPHLALTARQLWQRLARYEPTAVAGMTLSADPLIAGVLFAALDDGVELTGAIIRKEAKSYGRRRLVEGRPIGPDDRIVLVDDLLNGGTTADACLQALAPTRAPVCALGVIVDFGLPAPRRRLRQRGVAVEALFTTSDIGLAARLPSQTLRFDVVREELPAPPRARGGALPGGWLDGGGDPRSVASTSSDGLRFVRTVDGALTCWSASSGLPLWTRRLGEGQAELLAASGPSIVAGIHRRSLLGLDRSGAFRWVSTLSGGCPTSVAALAHERWATLASDGSLWILDGDDGAPLARYPAPDGTIAIASAGENRLCCVDDRGSQRLVDVVDAVALP